MTYSFILIYSSSSDTNKNIYVEVCEKSKVNVKQMKKKHKCLIRDGHDIVRDPAANEVIELLI